MARSALLALAIGVVSLTAVAVATSSPSPPALKNGGTLTIGWQNDPDALDPTLSGTVDGRNVFIDMCEKLYDINARLDIVPQLAAAMPKFSVNKKTVTIKLRTGIRFNDGTPFNAAAVKQSIERHKTMPRSMRASELAPVASVDAQGNNTVVLHLNNRYAPLTSQLADRAGMVMSPKALNELGDKFATNPVCVGPFMFKERVVGDHITLVRSPYYRDKNKVHLDQIVIRIINDPAARAASLRSHDIDVAPIASTELQSVTHDPSLRVIKSVSLGYQGISINIGNKSGIGKPYENVGTTLAKSADLRQAFELALDRNLINRVVFGGVNKPSCSPFPDQNPYAVAAKAVPCHLTARVAAAKAAFGRSGAKSPVDVRMLIGTTTIAAGLGALIPSLEKPVGFNVIPEPTESATGLSRAAAGKFGTFALGWSGRVDPDANLHQFVNSKGSSNYSGYMNPVVDRATNQARSIHNPKRRIQQYHVALAQLSKDVPLIYLYNPINRGGVSRNVAGVQVFADGLIRAAFAGFKK